MLPRRCVSSSIRRLLHTRSAVQTSASASSSATHPTAPAPPSAALLERIQHAGLRSKICTADQAAAIPGLFEDGSIIGLSGFTGVGYPKLVPHALVRRVKSQSSPVPRLSVLSGASTGKDIEDAMVDAGMVAFRAPYQAAPKLVKAVNSGKTTFTDVHLSKFAEDLLLGWYGKQPNAEALKLRYGDPEVTKRPLPKVRNDGRMDTVVVEASAIDANGELILGSAVGATPEMLHLADNIIIEINTAIPNMKGWHDLADPATFTPPFNYYVPIRHVDDRAGMKGFPLDFSKVRAIIESRGADEVPTSPIDPASVRIAGHLMEFFENEVRMGRLPANLLPLQSGIGNIANAVIGGLANCNFRDLQVWTEVLQDQTLPLIDSGKVSKASTCSLKLSQSFQQRLVENEAQYKDKIVLRPQRISNSPALIHRLGVIAMNTPLEVDIYGHANSTCAMGSKMVHGLGGSGDFLRHARLSIMHTPSTRPSATDPEGISCIVPFASHIDHTEHDLDIVVTEQGLADLRGLGPRERAREIISKCAHPAFRPLLMDYLQLSEAACKTSMHEPHMLKNAFQMHVNLQQTGTMKTTKWL